MSIIVLDWERDQVWSYGEAIEQRYLNAVQLLGRVDGPEIACVEFKDGCRVQLYVLDKLMVVTRNYDIDRAAMVVRDAIGRDNIDGLCIIKQRERLSQAFSGRPVDAGDDHPGVRCIEVAENGHMQGKIVGSGGGTLSVSNGSKYILHVRPGMVFEDSAVKLSKERYEQVRYCTELLYPCSIDYKREGQNVVLECTSRLETDIQDMSIFIPSIVGGLREKRLDPDNLLHKCTATDEGLTWTILCLHPAQAITLTVQPLAECKNRPAMHVTMQYMATHHDMMVNGCPLSVLRKYDMAPVA